MRDPLVQSVVALGNTYYHVSNESTLACGAGCDTRLRWVVGFCALMYALVILFDEGRYNTNLYFAEHRYKRGLPRKRLPVLVVSAKLLDEALLALSTEAVVAAELFPRVDELLHPERSWPLHQLFAFVRSRSREQTGGEQADHPWVDDSQTGRYWASLSNVFASLLPFLVKVVFDFIYYATAFIWYLPRRYLNGRIARLLGDAVTAATHGLSAADVQGARIETSCHVGITHVFVEEFRDVSEVALRAPLAAPATADRKRYDFLVEPE